MKKEAERIFDTPYDVIANNCADLVESVAMAGGINLFSDSLGIGGITIPNDQFNIAETIAEQQNSDSINNDSNNEDNDKDD